MIDTSNSSAEQPGTRERQSAYPPYDPSRLHMAASGSPVQQTLDAAVDDNIKLFCEQVAKSNDLDSLAYSTAHLADGTDGISTLPSALPSGVNPLVDNNLRKADGTDGKKSADITDKRGNYFTRFNSISFKSSMALVMPGAEWAMIC